MPIFFAKPQVNLQSSKERVVRSYALRHREAEMVHSAALLTSDFQKIIIIPSHILEKLFIIWYSI